MTTGLCESTGFFLCALKPFRWLTSLLFSPLNHRKLRFSVVNEYFSGSPKPPKPEIFTFDCQDQNQCFFQVYIQKEDHLTHLKKFGNKFLGLFISPKIWQNDSAILGDNNIKSIRLNVQYLCIIKIHILPIVHNRHLRTKHKNVNIFGFYTRKRA